MSMLRGAPDRRFLHEHQGDIDVLDVRPPSVDTDDAGWHANVTDFAAYVMRWIGNSCEILDRSGGSCEPWRRPVNTS